MLNINKIILCCVAFVSITAISFTQEGDITVFRKKFKSYFSTQPDSSYYFLKKILKQHVIEPDSIKSKDLNNVALYFMYQNKKDSSVIYFQRSLSIGSEKNNIGTLINLAILYKRNSQNNKAISLFEDLLSNNYLTNKNKGKIYSQLASLYSLKNNFKKSKENFEKALPFLKDAGSLNELANYQNNLANFYKKNQLHDLALPLYEKGASYHLSIKDYRSYYLTLINYSNCFLELDDITRAQSILNRIQQKYLLKIKDLRILAEYYNLKGNILLKSKKNNNKDSIGYFFKTSFNIVKKLESNETLEHFDDYIRYLSSVNDTLKLKEEFKRIAIDSIYNHGSLFDKTSFLKTLEILKKNDFTKDLLVKENLFKLSDSLNKKVNNVIKTELLKSNKNINSLKTQNNLIKEKNKYQILFILSIVTFSFVLLILTYKKRTNILNALIGAEKKSLKSYKGTAIKSKAILSKKIIDLDLLNLNLREALNTFNSTDKSVDEKNKYWKNFIIKFNENNEYFSKNLIKKHPKLTSRDLEFCMLLKLNFTMHEISQILSIQYRSVVIKKGRLKRKLNLDSKESIERYLLQDE
jgi:DNA-binding CsgD family transcriptional regulator